MPTVLPSVNESHSYSDNIWEAKLCRPFCLHMVSYEFQNLEILQPLESTRLHIKGLKFEMSFSISVQMRLRHFWIKKKNAAFHDWCLTQYPNELGHRLTRRLSLSAETQISSDHVDFPHQRQILILSGRSRVSELGRMLKSLLLITFDNSISLKAVCLSSVIYYLADPPLKK